MTPRFSIIVPVYKTEKYLRQCVDSILGQSFGDFEVILVDDGSPDGSGAICDAYAEKDSRVKVVHKENGGLVSARKAGLAQCRGEYVVNVDSDDYIAADLLERIADALGRHAVQVVLYGAVSFSEQTQSELKGTLAQGLYAEEDMAKIREGLIQNQQGELTVLFSIWSMAVARKLYEHYQNAVPAAISRGEDLVVTAPLLDSCTAVYVLDYCGYYYRSNPNSITNTFRLDEIGQIKQVVTYLSGKLGPEYEGKLDVYALTHYFDFLDRAMLRGWKEYRRIVRQTQDAELFARIRRARCSGGLKLKLIFFLMRHKCYHTLWLLRRIKKRT